MPSFAVGRILGFPVRVNLSFLLLLGLVMVWMGGVTGLALVSVAFASVLLHELGHAVVARRLGVRIKEIELHFFGGAAKMLDMPRRPRDEIQIAAAGPAVSLVLSAALYAGAALTGWEGFFWPAVVNLGIAVFNLLPALPMDGGRILRAALSGRMGHLPATELAVKISRVLAVTLGLVGLFFGHLQLAALAVLLWVMGSAELRVARVQAQRAQVSPFDMWGRWAEAWPRWSPQEVPVAVETNERSEVEYLPPSTRGAGSGGARGPARTKPLRVVIFRA